MFAENIPDLLCSLTVFFVTGMMMLLGCKGGSTPAGIRFRGSLDEVGSTSAPIPGATITIVDTGESDQTDENGLFEIQSTTFSESVSIQVSGSGINDTVSLDNISDSTEILDVSLVFDSQTGKISVASVQETPVSQAPDTTVTTLPPSAPAVPGATPTAGATPAPGKPRATPTPTPKPTGPFDSHGNTTEFGIPRGLTGNIGRGSGVWGSNCGSCHGQKRGASYGTIRGALSSIPQMRHLSISSQQTADLAAFLNR